MTDRVHVAVGVIYNQKKDKILITKRTAKQHLAGLWEFPGGKVEESEDVVTALKRELYEELGVIVKTASPFIQVSYDYPDKKVLLDVWQVNKWTGKPESKENQEIIWSTIQSFSHYQFPEANIRIIQALSLASLYLISKGFYQDYSTLLTRIEECFKSGLKLFQLRLDAKIEPGFSVLIKKLNILSERYSAKIILNGDVADIDKYNLDGLHLKSNQLNSYHSRPISEEYLLGASCHNEQELLLAEKLNVNYAFLSPVNKTRSHEDKKGMGWKKFYEMSKNVSFPVYALGGMRPEDIDIAKANNAHGIAMISAIWGSSLPVNKILQR